MSKIGKKTIVIPQGVEVKIATDSVSLSGPKGQLNIALHPKVRVVAAPDNTLAVSVVSPADRRQKALWGTYRALLNNAAQGVSGGFEKKLEIIGVGYKSAFSGSTLTLNVGYSHPVELEVPKELEVKVEKNVITVSGIDKQAVGQFASIIRQVRKPEPYKGKGIRYMGEVVRRKAGKVVKAVGG